MGQKGRPVNVAYRKAMGSQRGMELCSVSLVISWDAGAPAMFGADACRGVAGVFPR